MVRDHVPKCPSRFVITGSAADAESFCNGDLHVVDEIAVPDRLENAVAEAEDQDVLNRFFSKIMVDPIDLPFAEQSQKIVVQLFSGFQVAAKGLFENEPSPIAVLLFPEAVLDDFSGDICEQVWRDRHVIEEVLRDLVLLADFFEQRFYVAK